MTKKIKDNYVNDTYSLECLLNQIDSSTFLNSNFYLQSQKINKQVGSHVSIKSVAMAISNTFVAKDFEHPFYRSHMLISFLMVADKEQAYIRHIPKESSKYNGESELVYIKIDSTNNIFVNNKMSNINEFQKILKSKLDSSDKKIIIKLSLSKQAEYSLLSKVYKIIESAYNEKWGELSNKKFAKPFNLINDREKNEIKIMFPIAIIEDLTN